MAKHAVWLSGLVEFEDAEAILEKIGQIVMSDSSVWRRVETWGERGKAAQAVQRATATTLPPRSEIVAGEARQPKDMGIAMDGAKVHIRQEGWKELKVGCLFDIAMWPTPDKETGDLIDVAHAVRNSYVAHLGGPEVFGQLVWAEARQRAWTQARETIALGDGAPWIWNLVKDHFYDSRQGVDWYHATEHLWQAGRAVHGEGTPETQALVKGWKSDLRQGFSESLEQELRELAGQVGDPQEVLRKTADYLNHQQARLRYPLFRAAGWPIGSGIAEGGCKNVIGLRFKRKSARWKKPGFRAVLYLRLDVLNQRWEKRCDFLRKAA